MKDKKKKESICCPICGRRVARWDGKSTIPIHVNCKKCKKRIIFEPETQKVSAKEIPKRPFSSGLRFY